MNWIEIDKILVGIAERHDNTEDMFAEVEKQFKWTRSQSEAAINPLLKRHSINITVAKKPKTAKKLPKKVAKKRK